MLCDARDGRVGQERQHIVRITELEKTRGIFYYQFIANVIYLKYVDNIYFCSVNSNLNSNMLYVIKLIFNSLNQCQTLNSG